MTEKKQKIFNLNNDYINPKNINFTFKANQYFDEVINEMLSKELQKETGFYEVYGMPVNVGYYTNSSFTTMPEMTIADMPTVSRKVAIIFGVTGQDGSYLSEILLDKGYTVIGVKRRSSVSNTHRIDHIKNEKFIVVEGDVTDTHSVAELVREHKPTHIYNLAAQSHVGTSFKQPVATWDSTATGCVNILNAILTVDKTIRFYQASTSEMFGKNYSENIVTSDYSVSTDKDGNLTEKHETITYRYQDEETEFMPQSPYAVAKLAAHHMVRLYRESYGLFACSGILFNHESPRRGENFVTRKITKYVAKVVNFLTEIDKLGVYEDYTSERDVNGHFHIVNKCDEQAIEWCKEKFGALELGNLDAKRDWGFARDYCEGMVSILEHDKADDFVLATGETHSVRDLLREAFGAYELDYEDFVVINPEFIRPAEVDFLKGNSTKANEILGWKPTTNFRQLVNIMVESDRGYEREKAYNA